MTSSSTESLGLSLNDDISFLDDVNNPEEDLQEDPEGEPEEDPEQDLDELSEEEPEELMEEVPQEEPHVTCISGPRSETLFPIEPLHLQPFMDSSDSKSVPTLHDESPVEDGEEVDQPLTPALAMSIAERDAAKLTNIKGVNGVIFDYIGLMTDKKNTAFYLKVIMEYIRAVRVRGKPKQGRLGKKYWLRVIEFVSNLRKPPRKLKKLRKAMLDYCKAHIE